MSLFHPFYAHFSCSFRSFTFLILPLVSLTASSRIRPTKRCVRNCHVKKTKKKLLVRQAEGVLGLVGSWWSTKLKSACSWSLGKPWRTFCWPCFSCKWWLRYQALQNTLAVQILLNIIHDSGSFCFPKPELWLVCVFCPISRFQFHFIFRKGFCCILITELWT